MHKALRALSLFAGSVATAQAAAQAVSDQSVFGFFFTTDSAGEILEVPIPQPDLTAAPASFNLYVENEEPLSSPLEPTFHTVTLDANLDSTGSNWSGSGRNTAHYADALDLSLNYGGSHIPAATSVLFHTIDFSVDSPTTVDVAADFLIEMTDPFNPVPVANSFGLLFRDSGDNTVYETGFDSTLLGVSQQRNDTFVLAPGDYAFRLTLNINTQERLGFRDGSIDFSYNVSFVPTPASALLLVGGAVVGMRRRR